MNREQATAVRRARQELAALLDEHGPEMSRYLGAFGETIALMDDDLSDVPHQEIREAASSALETPREPEPVHAQPAEPVATTRGPVIFRNGRPL